MISTDSCDERIDEDLHQESKESDDTVEDCKLEAILALRNVVMKQREKLKESKFRERLHMTQINRLSSSLVQGSEKHSDKSGDSVFTTTSVNRKRVVFFGPSFERSDDVSGLTSTMDDSSAIEEEDIRHLVSSIQEQASQVETAMALDELESIKAEHQTLLRLYANKETEIETMRQQLDDCQQHVSTLELQKELAQAEAAKSKEDLQVCLSHLKEHSYEKEEELVEEDTKKSDWLRTPRRFFPLRSHRSINRSANRQSGSQKPNTVSDKKSNIDSPNNRLLCLACKFGESNHQPDRTLMETPVKSTSDFPYTVTPSPGENDTDLQDYQSEIAIYYKTEAERLQSKLKQSKHDHAQQETTLAQQVYQCEQDNREAVRHFQKQMRQKDIQIAQLRQEVTVSCQRQHGKRRSSSRSMGTF